MSLCETRSYRAIVTLKVGKAFELFFRKEIDVTLIGDLKAIIANPAYFLCQNWVAVSLADGIENLGPLTDIILDKKVFTGKQFSLRGYLSRVSSKHNVTTHR